MVVQAYLHGRGEFRSLVGSDGPVDQVQVKILGLKFLHALQAVLANLTVISVPQLCGQPKVLAADLSLLVQFLKGLANTSLVPVCLGAVDVSETQSKNVRCKAAGC